MLSSPLQKGMKALMWPKSPSGTGSICLYTRAASLTENGDCFHAKEPTRRFCRAAARAGGAGVSPAVSLVRFCTSRNEHPLASLAGKQSFFPSLRDTPIRPACGRPPSPRRRLTGGCLNAAAPCYALPNAARRMRDFINHIHCIPRKNMV